MKHGSLFSGIGGFDLAAEWMGWDNIFHCEINPFCQKVLKHHFPNAESLTDITKTDFTKYNGTIDIISGGFPCQPYSLAGKRKGKEDDRHLWPEMLRAIREIQPGWVVGENVFGLLNWNRGMVFHEVQTDLEAAGFECFPYVLPACAVNAPHRRDRVWFVAYSNSKRNNRSNGTESRNNERQFTENKEQSGNRWAGEIERYGQSGDATYPGSIELQGRMHKERTGEAERYIGSFDAWFNERGTWQDFPTQSPVCGRNDGVSDRVDRIKALGNAIVPQVAFEIFRAIEQTELNFFAPTSTNFNELK